MTENQDSKFLFVFDGEGENGTRYTGSLIKKGIIITPDARGCF